MSRQNHIKVVESEAETSDSNDSQEDPSFDILEETQSNFSKLSIKRKPRSRVPVELDEDIDFAESSAPEFDASDEKSYEIVQKIIEGGQVEKLKVEQCKLYLRKHGLRLTGKKDVLIQRIKEHISIRNGEGELKYPASSFVMNCKGDACTGDVVMFEQNVYEMFNVASRSASGPPCGKRIVAGRIVKESYGTAKQQHTFTIEVLWSKGVKPLPPLHPLLIKGRNLYRLKTLRQIWEDESQRQKILCEKHARGNAARTDREVRLHEKKTRQALQENRHSRGNLKNEKLEMKRKASPTRSMTYSRTSIPPETISLPAALSNPHVNNRGILGNRLLTSMLHNHHGALHNENINPNTSSGSVDGPFNRSFQVKQNIGLFYPYPSRANSINYNQNTPQSHYGFQHASNYHQNPPQSYYGFQHASNSGNLLPMGGHYHYYQGKGQKLCKYYAQGRCRHGTNCKYLH